jgi:uncharacterized protein (DUF433 family)
MPCDALGQQLGLKSIIAVAREEAAMPERIAVRSDIHFGKPCDAGTRITVQSVLELVREGVAAAEICHDFYPDLTPEDVQGCVQVVVEPGRDRVRRPFGWGGRPTA